jgi:hypothetical protein
LREDEHGVPGLLQCVKGRSNGELNVRVAADSCHAKGGVVAPPGDTVRS